MLNMPQIQDIRDMARDRSVASISRSLSVDEKTVRKYLKQDDFSPQPPEKTARRSRLDAHKHLIDRWLAEDETRWYKQRHTGKRIYERLREESPGFDCSYVVVQRYENRLAKRTGNTGRTRNWFGTREKRKAISARRISSSAERRSGRNT